MRQQEWGMQVELWGWHGGFGSDDPSIDTTVGGYESTTKPAGLIDEPPNRIARFLKKSYVWAMS